MRVKPFVPEYDKLKNRARRMERQIAILIERNSQLADRLVAAKQEVLEERKKVQEWLFKRLDGQQI